ncbi:hypothetical protein [Butyrivibrio sp.]|uniref:hypothetical protein n=1 Tax=Butyrivibrio sp. TaxID=28121 RepID=UPI001B2EE234|nr:hypothetical protein [Butyrivibrio sp.]MBO5621732.1 hypothetical protein [Butyrivibrio sp.]MBP3816907.1 hypothetical protein [Butyrivibrio sp.]MBQ9302043.1 hypothetical protein [Butyrivibrio sp.]
MSNTIWFKNIFKALIYIIVGLIILLVGYHRNLGITIFGVIIMGGGLILLGMSIVSFIKWLVG